MNNVDQVAFTVKPKKIVIIKAANAPKLVVPTVGQVFAEFTELNIDTALFAKPYDGTKAILLEVTRAVAAESAKDAALKTSAPTISYASKKKKEFIQEWWTHLTDYCEAGIDTGDKALRKAIDYEVNKTFDAVFHKVLTGQDLPDTKDGFSHNAFQALRRATAHGDAAIFLYRMRYWWPKARVVIAGRKWIAKTHKQWADELGMEERSFRTAYNHVFKLELIEAQIAKFNGVTINHTRPTKKTEKLFNP
ncbi:hypothetical protein [Rhizobium ruizarguesonis]|uniref:hypothetical protein n=1 Tax=Rhizobium ruizarguesonis TaxID=2081791 RepID=UPI00102FD3D8|nr:hypothetical protein [Rhizobium ruizarguesonis]TBD79691.1 hypothetical protein ELH11_07110 [Rhizobium ruizarguesonis]TBE10849.1 hypothetical protein ELH09_07180 [Rhizobium ruizarguesonis]